MYDRNITINSSLEGVFAVVEKRDGYRPEVHYVLKDNLGSWTTITYAWGNRRNVSTWNGPAHDVPLFDRGFTGHEHYDDFGLINMNGRVYDPYMSTFLSPDNYIQASDNSQNFNRYAYCLNNPLKYTDPSGEVFAVDGRYTENAALHYSYIEYYQRGYIDMCSTIPGPLQYPRIYLVPSTYGFSIIDILKQIH